MKLFIEIISILWTAFSEMLKIIFSTLPSYIDMAKALNDIKSIFSIEGILQYGFGVPEIVITILGTITIIVSVIKFLHKKGVIS